MKIVVAHPGKQHSFQVAVALNKHNLLGKYVTTIYDKENSLLMKLIKRIVSNDNRDRANSRKTIEIEDSQVITINQINGLIEIFLARYDKTRKYYNFWQKYNADSFGKKVAKLAIKEKADIVITFDTNALACFSYLIKYSPNIIRIMDVSAANRIYMRSIYEKDMIESPAFSKRLKQERAFLWEKRSVKRLKEEIDKTQFFLAPSQFVKESLLYSGVYENNIYICPYGANFSISNNNKRFHMVEKLELIYVGNVTEMKGIYYLLEAFLQLDESKYQLTVVGAFDNSDHLFDKYMKKINFIGRVTHEKVKELLEKSDIFVFPSLGEGLSLSVLEALSCGLPCIVTTNSGANDAIKDFENGFVVDIQSSTAIVEKLSWFDANRHRLPEMSKKAKESAQRFSWENYENALISSINDIIYNRNGNYRTED